MLTRRRIKQWLVALRLAGVTRVPWLGMAMAVLGGPVPRAVWRQRMRHGCFQCPLWSSVQMPGTTKGTDRVHLCKSTHPDMLGMGCNCYLPFLAWWTEPYPGGCVGQSIDPSLGWGAYRYPSLWAQLRGVLDFILYPLHKRANKFQPRIPPRHF